MSALEGETKTLQPKTSGKKECFLDAMPFGHHLHGHSTAVISF